jgi:hypothetical protein
MKFVFKKALLSHRHGASFLPTVISDEDFKKLKENMLAEDLKYSSNNDIFQTTDIVSHCYRQDENDPERPYKLLTLDRILESANVKDNIAKHKLWIEIDKELLKIFQHAATQTNDQTIIDKFFCSSKKWIKIKSS